MWANARKIRKEKIEGEDVKREKRAGSEDDQKRKREVGGEESAGYINNGASRPGPFTITAR